MGLTQVEMKMQPTLSIPNPEWQAFAAKLEADIEAAVKDLDVNAWKNAVWKMLEYMNVKKIVVPEEFWELLLEEIKKNDNRLGDDLWRQGGIYYRGIPVVAA